MLHFVADRCSITAFQRIGGSETRTHKPWQTCVVANAKVSVISKRRASPPSPPLPTYRSHLRLNHDGRVGLSLDIITAPSRAVSTEVFWTCPRCVMVLLCRSFATFIRCIADMFQIRQPLESRRTVEEILCRLGSGSF